MKRTITVKISRRPTNIRNAKKNLAKSFKWAKENIGPILPNPGPTLLILVMTALQAVMRSSVKKDMTRELIINIKRYKIANPMILVIMLGCIDFLLYLTVMMAFG